MNILNALISLRDDIKTWVSNNLKTKANTSHTHDSIYGEEFSTSEDANLSDAQFKYLTIAQSDTNMPSDNNANGIMHMNTHEGKYHWQLGFSSNGNMYSRSANNVDLSDDIAWNKILTDRTALDALGITATAAELNYTDGVTSNIQAQLNNKAAALHTHDYLQRTADTRSEATTPNDYKNTIIFKGLKYNSVIGNPSNSEYSYLLGLRGWSDSSGGNSHELAFNNSGIYTRQGATTAFGDWEKILTSGCITLSGTTLKININT